MASYFQEMKRTFSTVVSGVGTISSGVGSVVSSVGTLSAAVSTTVLNMATEDDDLADFGDPNFANDLRGRLDVELRSSKRNKRRGRREKELSVDSGVASETMQGGSSETEDLEADGLEADGLEADGLELEDGELERVSSATSSLSISSADEFLEGLNFHQEQQDNNNRESLSSVEGRDEITHVTDEYLISTDSDGDSEFSLGTVDITATEVYLSRKRQESAESTSRTLGRSLNHSGNLSDLRRSYNDLSYDHTPRPLSSHHRSKSALTLSPLTTESTTKKLEQDSLFHTKSEVTLNTIKENDHLLISPRTQVQNFVEISHQDPTTIESFDSSSDGGERVKNNNLGADSLPQFDDDEDLLEVKDPFRESFVSSTGGFPFLNKQNIVEDDSGTPRGMNIPNNFNVGLGKTTSHVIDEADEDMSVIETISEISVSHRSCKVGPEYTITPIRGVGMNKGANLREPLITSANIPKQQVSKKDSVDSNTTITSQMFEKSVADSPKRKNYLTPPSQKKSPKTSAQDTIKSSVQKDSPRSLTQRSTSYTHLHSKTEDHFTRSASGTLDGFNSLDKTKSYADVTYSPQCFPTESSPTVDLAEKSVTVQNTSLLNSNSPEIIRDVIRPGSHFQSSSDAGGSSVSDQTDRKISVTSSVSTFYSFSSEEHEHIPNVILNGKNNKSFMTNMKNSFKRLTNFLSLSRKKEKELSPIVPVPPPQHTKPEETTRGKYRTCVRPASPSLAEEFNQRSRSMSNIKLNITNTVKVNNKGDEGDVDNGVNLTPPPDNTATDTTGNSPKEKTGVRSKSMTPSYSRKKNSPSLMSHITSHYSGNSSNNSVRSTSLSPKRGNHALSQPGLAAATPAGTPPRNYSAIYKSSPGSLLPSPPASRKPVWRETKASRLRLNRVKAPSMSSLNL